MIITNKDNNTITPFTTTFKSSSDSNYTNSGNRMNTSTTISSDITYSANVMGQSTVNVCRIRTPSLHDVLSGRGGSVNAHPGNCQFRDYVQVYKEEYNLAKSKQDKASICRLVIDKVISHGGRFLTKESPNSQWWIEQDDERIMAKTSQALREGAPKIREAHREEFNSVQQQQLLQPSLRSINNNHKRKVTTTTRNQSRVGQISSSSTTTTLSGTKRTSNVMTSGTTPLTATTAVAIKATNDNTNVKRVRVNYMGHLVHTNQDTPPLSSVTTTTTNTNDNHNELHNFQLDQSSYPPDVMTSKKSQVPIPRPIQFPPPLSRTRLSSSSGRTNSLAVSDIIADDTYEFVNPFDDESDIDAYFESKSINDISTTSLTTSSSLSEVGRNNNTILDMNAMSSSSKSIQSGTDQIRNHTIPVSSKIIRNSSSFNMNHVPLKPGIWRDTSVSSTTSDLAGFGALMRGGNHSTSYNTTSTGSNSSSSSNHRSNNQLPLNDINNQGNTMVSTITTTTPELTQLPSLPHVVPMRSTSGGSQNSSSSMNNESTNNYRYVPSDHHCNHVNDDIPITTTDQNIINHDDDDDCSVASDTTLGLPLWEWFNRDETISSNNHHESSYVIVE